MSNTISFSATNSKTLIIVAGSYGSGFLPKFYNTQTKLEADICFFYSDGEQYDSLQKSVGEVAGLSYINTQPTPEIIQKWIANKNPNPGKEGFGGNGEYATFVFEELTKNLLTQAVLGADKKPKYDIVLIVGCPEGATFGECADLYGSTVKELGVPISHMILSVNKFDMKTPTKAIEGERRIHSLQIIQGCVESGLSVSVIDGDRVQTYYEDQGETVKTLQIIEEMDKKVIDIMTELANKVDAVRPTNCTMKGTINDSDVVTAMKNGGYCAPFVLYHPKGNINSIVKQIKETNFLLPRILDGKYIAKKGFLFIEGRELDTAEESKIKEAIASFGVYGNATNLKDRHEIYDDVDFVKITFLLMDMEQSKLSDRLTDKAESGFGNDSNLTIAQQMAEMMKRMAEMQSKIDSQPVSKAFESSNEPIQKFTAFMNPKISDEAVAKSTKLTESEKVKVMEMRTAKFN
jgi:hypothetical protein